MTCESRLDALNLTLARARRGEFYRERLPATPLNSLAALAEIPLTTKEDLRSASPYGLLCVPLAEVAQYHESFGTTGTPVSAWYTEQDLRDNDAQIDFGDVGLGATDLMLIRFPYAISSAAHLFHHAAQARGAGVIPASSRSTVSPYPRVITLLHKLGVTVMAALPLQGLLLARTAELMGFVPSRDFPELRAICTAGETLTPVRRDLLHQLWGVPVFNFYGLTELGNVASDCRFGHLHPHENFLVEVLADDLRSPAEPGQAGHLVVTTLRRQASPVIRFLTGDRARLVPGCPCGRGDYLELRGRTADAIEAGGRLFDQWELEEIVSHLPCKRFWAVAPAPWGLHFVVEQETPWDTVSPDLRRFLERKFGVGLAFEVVHQGSFHEPLELLSASEVGKPRYIYTEEELRRGAHLGSKRT
ncbi:MAG: phenylacetate--CoA ligase family protein [Chitinophagales bacterium]